MRVRVYLSLILSNIEDISTLILECILVAIQTSDNFKYHVDIVNYKNIFNEFLENFI